MSEDREIVRAVWEGEIPMKFNLTDDEVYSMEKPRPFYQMMSRIGYMTQLSDKLQRHFIEYINKDDLDEVWLDYNGYKLKWNYPVGLLYDLLAYGEPLPWSVTVHLTKFPQSDILRMNPHLVKLTDDDRNGSNVDNLQSYFIMSIKEADALRHRSQVMSNLLKSDYMKLWFGFKDLNFDQFWSVNRRLIERICDEPFKYVPFRIYDSELNSKTKLVSPVSMETGDAVTLDDLLKSVLPPNTYERISLGELAVIIHGLEIKFTVSMQWLSENLSYPDNFLHIALVSRKNWARSTNE